MKRSSIWRRRLLLVGPLVLVVISGTGMAGARAIDHGSARPIRTRADTGCATTAAPGVDAEHAIPATPPAGPGTAWTQVTSNDPPRFYPGDPGMGTLDGSPTPSC